MRNKDLNASPLDIIWQLLKYFAVGGSAVLIYVTPLAYIETMTSWNVQLANFLCYVAATLYSFVLSYYFTFNSVASKGSALGKYIALALVGLSINTPFVFVLTTVFGISASLAGLLFSALWPLVSFYMQKTVVFSS